MKDLHLLVDVSSLEPQMAQKEIQAGITPWRQEIEKQQSQVSLFSTQISKHVDMGRISTKK